MRVVNWASNRKIGKLKLEHSSVLQPVNGVRNYRETSLATAVCLMVCRHARASSNEDWSSAKSAKVWTTTTEQPLLLLTFLSSWVACVGCRFVGCTLHWLTHHSEHTVKCRPTKEEEENSWNVFRNKSWKNGEQQQIWNIAAI